jgi:hypothetical protein
MHVSYVEDPFSNVVPGTHETPFRLQGKDILSIKICEHGAGYGGKNAIKIKLSIIIQINCDKRRRTSVRP